MESAPGFLQQPQSINLAPQKSAPCVNYLCGCNLKANSYEAFGQFTNTIYSKTLYTERNTKTSCKCVYTPRFFHKADLHAGKGKHHKNNPIAIQPKRTMKNNNVCVL